jgi:hypothetical protein
MGVGLQPLSSASSHSNTEYARNIHVKFMSWWRTEFSHYQQGITLLPVLDIVASSDMEQYNFDHLSIHELCSVDFTKLRNESSIQIFEICLIPSRRVSRARVLCFNSPRSEPTPLLARQLWSRGDQAEMLGMPKPLRRRGPKWILESTLHFCLKFGVDCCQSIVSGAPPEHFGGDHSRLIGARKGTGLRESRAERAYRVPQITVGVHCASVWCRRIDDFSDS